jgi:hypothetical protein
MAQPYLIMIPLFGENKPSRWLIWTWSFRLRSGVPIVTSQRSETTFSGIVQYFDTLF